jgi:DNA-binding response OmpR family regulator
MTLTMHLAQVVEDDRAAQKILRMLLQADGFRVVVSDCCVRGEQDARLRPPDVMIVDLGLPCSRPELPKRKGWQRSRPALTITY